MFERFIQSISRQVRGLHKAAYLLGFFTFISQLLGLVRDRLLASSFGAGTTLDIYYAAFKIPDLILVLGASVASISILVPYLTKKLQEGREEGERFIDAIFTVFSFFIIVIGVIVWIAAPYLTSIFFPGLSGGESGETLILLTRILLLSPVLLGISNLFASIVQVHNRFLVYAIAPVLYNLGIIFGVVILYPIFGIAGLGYGVVLGAAFHAGIQAPAVIREKLFPRFTLGINWEEIRRVVFISIPRAFTMSVTHIILIVLIGLASIMGEGSITIFNFSYNIQSVPLGIIGVSYSLAAFPELSRMFARGESETFVGRIVEVMVYILALALPAAILFVVLSGPIIEVLFGVGAFGQEAVRATSGALALFALSIPAQSVQLLLIRGYYAAGMTKKPLLIITFGGGLSILSAYALNALFRDTVLVPALFGAVFGADIAYLQTLILPLSYSLGMIVTAFLLWVMFVRDFGTYSIEKLGTTLLEIVYATAIVGIVAYGVYALIEPQSTRTLPVLLAGLTAGFSGLVCGIFVLTAFKNKALEGLNRILRGNI
ncbi:MAG: murein biosynthesis integral membrane protein MurJ [Candidatus Paceibacterota bacterium]